MSSLLRVGFVSGLLVGALIHIAALENPASVQSAVTSAAGQSLNVIAYSITFLLCWRIRKDHHSPSTMRLAWTLMAASSAVAILRHLFEGVMYAGRWNVGHPNGVMGLRQIPIVISLLLLTMGLAAMWRSYASIGLGLRFRAIDLFIAVALAGIGWKIWMLRDLMNDAHSIYPFIRVLQSASPAILLIPALLGLVLHRISQEMGKGQLSQSLTLLVLFLSFRMCGLLAGLSPVLSPYAGMPAMSAFFGASWLFALAVFHRLQMTVSVEGMVRRYDADPRGALRQLIRALESSTATLR